MKIVGSQHQNWPRVWIFIHRTKFKELKTNSIVHKIIMSHLSKNMFFFILESLRNIFDLIHKRIAAATRELYKCRSIHTLSAKPYIFTNFIAKKIDLFALTAFIETLLANSSLLRVLQLILPYVNEMIAKCEHKWTSQYLLMFADEKYLINEAKIINHVQ